MLALRLAVGLDGGRLTDASGVLRILLRQPFGPILLGVIGVGILTYAAWQVLEGVWDTPGHGSSRPWPPASPASGSSSFCTPATLSSEAR